MRALQHETHGEVAARVAADALRAAAMSFSKTIGIGADSTTFKDVAEASDESLAELSEIMREAIRHLAMPTQVLITLGSLLAKKLGGTT